MKCRLALVSTLVFLLCKGVSPALARTPTAPIAPTAPTAPTAPIAPTALIAPTAPTAPIAPTAVVLPGEPEFTGCQRYPADKRFRWGVRGEVTVGELAASVGAIGCLTIVLGPAAAAHGGKVTLEVPDLLTAGEVYRLFYSSLEVLGLTVERSGHVLKIVDVTRAKEVSQPLSADQPTPTGDQFVTRLLRAEHVPAQELAEVLGKLKSKDGDVSAYGAAGTSPSLILTDRATNVRRMEELAATLDVAQVGARLFSVAAHAQSPTELAATLEKILQATRRPDGGKGAAPPTTPMDGVSALVPVEAARMVVVVATEIGFHKVAQLAARIDPAIDADAPTGSQAHVIYLANTNAEEMAATLSAIGLSARGAGGARPSVPGAPSPSAGGAPLSSTSSPLSGEVRIGADKVSNSIVVFASGPDFLTVRDLVSKLDVPRRQVYVEATILDLAVDRARNLGVALHNGANLGSATGFAVSGSAGFNSVAVDAKTVAGALGAGGLVAGILGSAFSFAGASVPSFGVVVQALEHSKDVNVISRPHLLTTDNVKAELSVGQSIPFQTATLASGLAGLQSTYQRQDVVLRLSLTPHLNDSDSIRLEIDGEISDVPDNQAANQPGGPTTNKRTLKTAVVVRDGETIVLGGLQKESEGETIDRIPLLGDIPLIGRLFQVRSKQRLKQDLLIVLTPYVIRGPDDLRQIFERKEQEREDFIARSTAFQGLGAFDPKTDYRRRRGLVAEIDATARAATEEARAVRAAEKALKKVPVVEGPLGD